MRALASAAFLLVVALVALALASGLTAGCILRPAEHDGVQRGLT